MLSDIVESVMLLKDEACRRETDKMVNSFKNQTKSHQLHHRTLNKHLIIQYVTHITILPHTTHIHHTNVTILQYLKHILPHKHIHHTHVIIGFLDFFCACRKKYSEDC